MFYFLFICIYFKGCYLKALCHLESSDFHAATEDLLKALALSSSDQESDHIVAKLRGTVESLCGKRFEIPQVTGKKHGFKIHT